MILHPSRVTSKTNTLIDNIFINDLTCYSTGGNITSSISDHFPQFCQTNIFECSKNENNIKYARNFKNFKECEFLEELQNIEWTDVTENGNNTNTSFDIFLAKIEYLLDIMAPVRKMTKRELGLQKRPWITKGILTSMRKRDQLYKNASITVDPIQKSNIFKRFKKYRNLIITLQRKSKGNYFLEYFSKYQNNMKKTWDGIRNVLNVSKKKSTMINQLLHKNKILTSNKEKSNALNEFFVNIGSTIEEKIPHGKKHFSHYLNSPNFNSIFLKKCELSEIVSVISNLNISKACGPNSIPTNLLKISTEILAPIIVILINKSFCDGIFPDLLKTASVCPIYKKV